MHLVTGLRTRSLRCTLRHDSIRNSYSAAVQWRATIRRFPRAHIERPQLPDSWHCPTDSWSRRTDSAPRLRLRPSTAVLHRSALAWSGPGRAGLGARSGPLGMGAASAPARRPREHQEIARRPSGRVARSRMNPERDSCECPTRSATKSPQRRAGSSSGKPRRGRRADCRPYRLGSTSQSRAMPTARSPTTRARLTRPRAAQDRRRPAARQQSRRPR